MRGPRSPALRKYAVALGGTILFSAGSLIHAEDGAGVDGPVKMIAWLSVGIVVFATVIGTIVHREAKRIFEVVERMPDAEWFTAVGHLVGSVQPSRLKKHYRMGHMHGNWLLYLNLSSTRMDADLSILWEKVFGMKRAPLPAFDIPDIDEEE